MAVVSWSTDNCHLPTVNKQLPTANCQLVTANCQAAPCYNQLMTLRDDLEAYQTSATIGKAKQVSRKPKYERKAPLFVSFQQFHNLISSRYDLGVILMRHPAPAGLFIPNMIALQIIALADIQRQQNAIL